MKRFNNNEIKNQVYLIKGNKWLIVCKFIKIVRIYKSF